MNLEVDMPASLGGGSFAMRELSAGEYEDELKRSARNAGNTTSAGKAAEAVLDMQADEIMLALETWHGKPVPKAGSEKEAFWRERTTRQREFLVGIFNKLHTVPAEEIGDFFEAAVAARAAKSSPPKSSPPPS